MSEDNFWIGSAPFCKPSPSQCAARPGYKYSGVKDKCGDGSCCWSGAKMKCERDATKTKTEGRWVGTAPVCNTSRCSVYRSYLIPTKTSRCGDGACCAIGQKWYGREPENQTEKNEISTEILKCQTSSPEKKAVDYVADVFTIGKTLFQ